MDERPQENYAAKAKGKGSFEEARKDIAILLYVLLEGGQVPVEGEAHFLQASKLKL